MFLCLEIWWEEEYSPRKQTSKDKKMGENPPFGDDMVPRLSDEILEEKNVGS